MPDGRREATAAAAVAPPPPDLGALSFEDALAELEAIVTKLEQGRGTLAEAIADYERGTALRKHCEARLGEAEAKVQAIVEGPTGSASSLRDVE